MWQPGGTANRIFGDEASATVARPKAARPDRDRRAEVEAKLNSNSKLSNCKRQQLKREERKRAGDLRKKEERAADRGNGEGPDNDTEPITAPPGMAAIGI